MTDLTETRKVINKIDAEMAALFERRMKAAEKVAEFKKENGLGIKDKTRESALIEANRKLISDPVIEGYYVQFLQHTVDLSCDYQAYLLSGMKVAYCGTEGAYAQLAAKTMFPFATLVSCSDFAEVYHAVEDGKYDCAVLPIENSYAGEVGTVMDLLFNGNLYINQMLDLPISHTLIAPKGSSINQIKTVVSHSQALTQCGNYISAHGFRTESYSNTALAAKYVSELNDPTVAAIASKETAELFNLDILERGINDVKNNTTRFAVFSRTQNNPAPSPIKKGEEKFSLVFTVKNEAGSLARTINTIGAHGYNMTNLRSRPMKSLQWEYYFYMELEGNVNTENGQDMMRELAPLCAKLKLVGSYIDKKAEE